MVTATTDTSEKTRDSYFSIGKTKIFYLRSKFEYHGSAQGQSFEARQYVTPVTKDLKGNTATLLTDALLQHTDQVRNWRI